MSKFLAPDDEHEWEDMGPATAKRWPNGIPSLICTPEADWFYVEYAGNVWRYKIEGNANDMQVVQK